MKNRSVLHTRVTWHQLFGPRSLLSQNICLIFLLKLKWPKNKSVYDFVHSCLKLTSEVLENINTRKNAKVFERVDQIDPSF